MNKLIVYLLVSFVFIQCKRAECENIPIKFSSYDEAVTIIKGANFTFVDNVNTSKSSWIEDSNYYSCDKKVGYLIMQTEKFEYIYCNIPMHIWNEFKLSKSFGKYYNEKIKGKYLLILKNK